MNAILCSIRKTTIVQVTKPPQSRWRFHWHELFPIAHAQGGNQGQPFYLPAVEPGLGRQALCSRLREALADLPPRPGSAVVVEGYVVQVLRDGGDFLPPHLDADLDAFIAELSSTRRRGPQPSTSRAGLSLSA